MITFQRTTPATVSPEGSTVARMAQTMLEGADHGIDEQALVRAGFTRAEIAAHAAEAADLANLTGRA